MTWQQHHWKLLGLPCIRKKRAPELCCTHGARPAWQDALPRSNAAMLINNGCKGKGKAMCNVFSRDLERRREGWGAEILVPMHGAAGEGFCIIAWRAEQSEAQRKTWAGCMGKILRVTAWFGSLGFHFLHIAFTNSLKK